MAAACFRARLAHERSPAGERTARVLAGYWADRRRARPRGGGSGRRPRHLPPAAALSPAKSPLSAGAPLRGHRGAPLHGRDAEERGERRPLEFADAADGRRGRATGSNIVGSTVCTRSLPRAPRRGGPHPRATVAGVAAAAARPRTVAGSRGGQPRTPAARELTSVRGRNSSVPPSRVVLELKSSLNVGGRDLVDELQLLALAAEARLPSLGVRRRSVSPPRSWARPRRVWVRRDRC